MKSFLYTSLLMLLFLALVFIPEPDFLRSFLLETIVLATLILMLLQLLFSSKVKQSTDPYPILSLLTIGLFAAIITGLFWFRSSAGPYGFETGLRLDIARTLFFWAPAFLFASLYRSAGEGWKPVRRKTLLIRLLVAIAGSLAGLAAFQFAVERTDSITMEYSLRHVERQLPGDSSSLTYNLDRSVLHLLVEIDPDHEEPNIRRLQRIRAVSSQASRIISRNDTDSLSLRINSGGLELARMNWPDPETNQSSDRIRFNYSGTGLSSLPTDTDLDLLFEIIEPAFRPHHLKAALEESTLVLRWTEDPDIPDNPKMIPAIVHDWQAANRIVIQAISVFKGIDAFRIEMPGHSPDIPAESVKGLFRAQRLIQQPDVQALIQMYDAEEMPETPFYDDDNAPVRIIRGDGIFDTQRNTSGPLWPWESTNLGGYHFYITDISSDGIVKLVMHPSGSQEDARLLSLQPGQTQKVFGTYLRYVP